MEQKRDLFVYAVRKRTSVAVKKINQILGTKLDRHSIYYRIKKIEDVAKKDMAIAKVVIDLKTL